MFIRYITEWNVYFAFQAKQQNDFRNRYRKAVLSLITQNTIKMGISNLSIGLGLGIVLQLTSPQKNYVQPNILQRGIEKKNLSITHSRASSLDKLESTEKQESTQDLSRMRLLLRPTF